VGGPGGEGLARADYSGFHALLEGYAQGGLHGPDECDRGCRRHFWRGLRGPAGIRNRFLEGHLSLDPRSGQHLGRARRPPIVVGALGSGLLAFGYLYAISIKNVPLAIVLSLLTWVSSTKGITPFSRAFTPSCSRRVPGFPRWRLRRTLARP
jgi:hypothetical protein